MQACSLLALLFSAKYNSTHTIEMYGRYLYEMIVELYVVSYCVARWCVM